MYPDDHVVPNTSSQEQSLSFPLLIHTSHNAAMSNQQIMVHTARSSYPDLWKFKAIPNDIQEHCCVTA